MLTISLSTENLLSQKVDCYAYIVEKNFDVKKLSDATKVCPDLAAVIKHRGFTGNLQEVISVPFSVEERLAFCIVVGMVFYVWYFFIRSIMFIALYSCPFLQAK